MRRPFGRGRDDEGTEAINLTPMLDVVFIMLIFFIVTATFVKEVGLDVNQPDEDKPKTIRIKRASWLRLLSAIEFKLLSVILIAAQFGQILNAFMQKTLKHRLLFSLTLIQPLI